MSAAPRVLLVDDDASLRRVTGYHLEKAGFELREAASAEAALAGLEGWGAHCVVSDIRMPGRDGMWLLQELRSRHPQVAVVLITAHGNIEQAVEAIRAGAHDYLAKPFDHAALRLTIDKALRLRELEDENARLRALSPGALAYGDIVAHDPAMLQLLEQSRQVARVETPVLLLGESGTGKELIARAIHEASPRAGGPWVAVNTGAMPEGLVDSELFGHVQGAFTGASADRQGVFERAHGGTLFLDEIGDLPLAQQARLLRVLQEGELQRVGDERTRRVDVRIVAATHRDLHAAVGRGEFREDLWYRLAVVPLRVPPLRERPDDLLPLLQHFLARHATTAPPPEFDEAALRQLRRHPWPGNARELENVVRRALALRPQGPLHVDTLPATLAGEGAGEDRLYPAPLPAGGLPLEALERELLLRALERSGGNQSAAARYLGISRNTLLYRLEKHQIR